MKLSVSALIIQDGIFLKMHWRTDNHSFLKKYYPPKSQANAHAPLKIPRADDAWLMSAGLWMQY
jgi:hypothetical protein